MKELEESKVYKELLDIEYPLKEYLNKGYKLRIGDKANLKYWLRTYWDDDVKIINEKNIDYRNDVSYCSDEHTVFLKVLPQVQ